VSGFDDELGAHTRQIEPSGRERLLVEANAGLSTARSGYFEPNQA
jgi:hypothetical protein